MKTTEQPSEYHIKNIECPSCDNRNAKLITHELDIPYYDDFVIVNINCSICGFRSSDFFNMLSKGHTLHEYSVDSIDDGTTKIVRAKNGHVSIPELGVKIEPVNEPMTWIRNVEGILNDIRTKIELMIKDPENEHTKNLAEQRLQLLDEMLEYKIPFTLIVEDMTGNSIILPARNDKLKITYFEENQ